MSRRSHITVVGSIATSDLSSIGAGEKEGWLSDSSSILTSLYSNAMAIANSLKSVVLVLGWDPPSTLVEIRPSLYLDDDGGRVSAIEWIPFGDLIALAVGTSSGMLLIFSVDGELIHKQLIYPACILRLRYHETTGISLQDNDAQQLSIVLPGVVARFDGTDIQSLLQRWFEEASTRIWEDIKDPEDDSTFMKIPFQLWSVNKYGSCVDAAIVGLMPPPLLELQSSQKFYCAVTVGEDSVISAYRLSVSRSRSLVGSILSKVVPATFSTISSFSRIIWRSGQSSNTKPRPTSQPFAKASPLTCIKDPPRKGENLTLSPSGTLAAITDSLGRILLLDTKALVVVRLWKGYRDASCLFMEMLISKDKTASSSSSYHPYKKSDYCLCLAIHAPRKEIIEVWKMRTGPRVLTIPCPKGSRILQSSTRFPSSSQSSSSSSSSSYVPLQVYLLNGDSGQLSILNKRIG